MRVNQLGEQLSTGGGSNSGWTSSRPKEITAPLTRYLVTGERASLPEGIPDDGIGAWRGDGRRQ